MNKIWTSRYDSCMMTTDDIKPTFKLTNIQQIIVTLGLNKMFLMVIKLYQNIMIAMEFENKTNQSTRKPKSNTHDEMIID